MGGGWERTRRAADPPNLDKEGGSCCFAKEALNPKLKRDPSKGRASLSKVSL